MGRGKENKVQAAIAGALEVYCSSRSLQLFPPYSNQQGGQKRKYCADLLGVVDGADLIALEVKELDVATGVLHAFDQVQHQIAKEFERLGVPLAYAYNAVESLPYHERPKPPNWERLTLASVKRSMPTPLPGPTPAACRHESLLDWLDGAHGTNAVNLFGRVHGALNAVDDLRNGILVLLYAVPQQTIAALQPADILRAVDVLKSSDSHLSSGQRDLLKTLIGASADVFDRFTHPAAREDNASNRPRRPRTRM
jgi:hypothetical protein